MPGSRGRNALHPRDLVRGKGFFLFRQYLGLGLARFALHKGVARSAASGSQAQMVSFGSFTALKGPVTACD
jgi:hypothetical protein